MAVGNLTVTDSDFTDCTAVSSAGGFTTNNFNFDAVVQRCRFTRCSAYRVCCEQICRGGFVS